MRKVTIHTDGACRPNPGPGGFAAIIITPDNGRITVTGGHPDTTNNRMEMAAVSEALQLIREQMDTSDVHITVASDSKYIVDAFRQDWMGNWSRNGWKTRDGDPVKNQPTWKALIERAQGLSIEWTWVRGHSGDPGNEEADRLAQAQAAVAKEQGRYWISVGNPRAQPEAYPPAPGDNPEEDNATEWCARVLQEVVTALSESDTFTDFRDRALARIADLGR